MLIIYINRDLLINIILFTRTKKLISKSITKIKKIKKKLEFYFFVLLIYFL